MVGYYSKPYEKHNKIVGFQYMITSFKFYIICNMD